MYRGMYIFPLLAAAATSLLLLNVTALPSCPISISTLGHVALCPKSEKEWNERAKDKKCEILAQYQNCTSVDAFSYHCILNENATRLVEVCAPKWFMTGYCARFSIQEERIINDPGLDCTTFVTPCPSRYPSTEAYKYQNCYAGVERYENKPANEHRPASSLFSSPVVWILIALSCGLLIALIIITALYITGNRKKSKEQNIAETEQCSESGPTSPEGKEQLIRLKTVGNEETNENGKIQAKAVPAKMQIKTLSGGRSVDCDLKEVQTVADLKIAVAKALDSSKELIEIVDWKNVILYQDDTVFQEFLKHENEINVIVRSRRENQCQNVSEHEENGNDENARMLFNLNNCAHNSNPVELFQHIHSELTREGIEVTCPDCRMGMVMDDAFQKCNMSHDEMCFYKEIVKRNWSFRENIEQWRM